MFCSCIKAGGRTEAGKKALTVTDNHNCQGYFGRYKTYVRRHRKPRTDTPPLLALKGEGCSGVVLWSL